MARNLEAVPDESSEPHSEPHSKSQRKKGSYDNVNSPVARANQRNTTTSFRIPIKMMNKVRDEAKRQDISISRIYVTALAEYFNLFDSKAWETLDASDGYDPTHFYTKSQDGKGHSVVFHVHVPKPLAAEIAHLAESNMIPAYRSPGDILRDAIYHRMKQVAIITENDELEMTVNMAMMMSDEMRFVDDQQQAEQLIIALKTNAQAIFAKDGAKTGRLKRYLAQRREMADAIPEPYRDDWLNAIDDVEKVIAKSPKRKRKKL